MKGCKLIFDVKEGVKSFIEIYSKAISPLDTATLVGVAAFKKLGEGFKKVYLEEGENGLNTLALTWIDAYLPPPSGQQG